ncbi:MAG: CHAT domain-containing protein [bacterium]
MTPSPGTPRPTGSAREPRWPPPRPPAPTASGPCAGCWTRRWPGWGVPKPPQGPPAACGGRGHPALVGPRRWSLARLRPRCPGDRGGPGAPTRLDGAGARPDPGRRPRADPGGRPLAEVRLDLAGRPAVHALDLPPREARPVGPATILIADPTGDLPGARSEADQVAPLLAAAGRPPRRITGGAVTRASLVDALAVADHLHYAGHGRYAGFEGWDSALPVHDGALEVGDLLLLSRVPAAVVLSGCETGRARGEAAVGLGLAHAFLVRGTDAVVAPVGPVDDGIAARFAVALYSALRQSGRLEAAYDAVATDSSAQDYRLFVP